MPHTAIPSRRAGADTDDCTATSKSLGMNVDIFGPGEQSSRWVTAGVTVRSASLLVTLLPTVRGRRFDNFVPSSMCFMWL